MSHRRVQLSFPARAEYLILGRLALAGVARAVAIDDEVLADLKLVVTEACGNVVRHAYAADGDDGRVHLAIDVTEGQATISVADDGIGLSSQTVPAPEELPESGMGLAIIAAIADEVEIGPSGANGGTTLTVRKRI